MVATNKKRQDTLLSITKAAAYLNKSPETVKKAMQAGQLPYRVLSSRKLIPVPALDRWLQGSDGLEKHDEGARDELH
jgi:hypothetical protein